jgi:metal-responsive CopG/Arc/MetJ family transcriptional regulator
MVRNRRRPEPERIAIPMPAELIKRIDDYRWSERVPSRAAAIRLLLDESLKRHERHERHGPKPSTE